MRAADLPLLDQLPRQNSSHVKNKWGDVVRQVRQAGSVAITNHSAIEMVLVDATTYQQLTARAAAFKAREQAVLDDLAAQFSQRLAVLQTPAAVDSVAAVFKRRGKLLGHRPKAGAAF